MENNKPKYVLIIRGQCHGTGDSVEELMMKMDLNALGGGSVKSFRYHEFIDGIPGGTFPHPHCKNCKRVKQANGSNAENPCVYPERSDDPTVEVHKYHAPHTDDMCCPEHKHHAKLMHRNCMLR
jgi:hypothetical protein